MKAHNRNQVIIARIKTNFYRGRSFLRRKQLNKFLKDVKGVIHVGGNYGQEREHYAKHDLPVVWIEPIPEIFEKLEANIAPYPKQIAIRALVTDKSGKEYEFNVSNNFGASSILDLKMHKDIWPTIEFTKTIKIKSKLLPEILDEAGIDISNYDALVMDTQGSEMLVLEGAEPILNHFRYIKTEAADFEIYEDCCQLSDIREFVSKRGYSRYGGRKFAAHPNGGICYDEIYKKTDLPGQ